MAIHRKTKKKLVFLIYFAYLLHTNWETSLKDCRAIGAIAQQRVTLIELFDEKFHQIFL
jgi:hypothetical protein